MIWVKRILLILVIICLGTVIDYVVHQADARFSVPSTYFPHKIFYGTLWGFVGYIVFKKFIKTDLQLAFVISVVPAVALQTMYFLEKHQLGWVVLFFLFGHFLMFLLPGYFIAKKFKEVFIGVL